MENVPYSDIRDVLSGLDEPLATSLGADDTSGDVAFESALAQCFAGKEHRQSVLGIDIYRYSRFPGPQQRVVPALFKYFYDLAAERCVRLEAALFHSQQFAECFISTGDGGFQIFDTPLHCITFATHLQTVITSFNGFIRLPRTRRFMGTLTLRYAITTDMLFRQDGNYYGSAIIANARILSRDALNRFLLDGATVEWFREHLGSVESLLSLSREDLQRMSMYDQSAGLTTTLFPAAAADKRPFRAVHLQHIGHVTAKSHGFEVYSLYLQVAASGHGTDTPAPTVMMIAIGSLNPSGLSA